MLISYLACSLLFNKNTTFNQDSEAILAICGGFEVTFQFEEIAPVQTDPRLKPPYEESAIEWVQLTPESGGHKLAKVIFSAVKDQEERDSLGKI